MRNELTTLQTLITSQQQVVTNRLVHSQTLLLTALVIMCVLVAAIAAGGVLVVRRWLLRPFTALRLAAETVAAGDYDNPIPAQGPAELTDLAASTEHMRTQLVAALAGRERAEQGFRRLFESAPDATLAVNPDGIIVIANAQAESLFGYAAGELTGQQVETLVPAEARTGHAAHRASYFADPKPRPMGADLQLSAVRRDGTQFPVEISLNGLPTEHGTMVTATIRDISERLAIQSERERLRTMAEQQRTQQRLQQAQKLESLGQLVGGVAHDFNNLLNIITGYTDLSTQQIQEMAGSDERLQPVLSDIGQVRSASTSTSTSSPARICGPSRRTRARSSRFWSTWPSTPGTRCHAAASSGSTRPTSTWTPPTPPAGPACSLAGTCGCACRTPAPAWTRPRSTASSSPSSPPSPRVTAPASASPPSTASSRRPAGTIQIYSEVGLGTTINTLFPASQEAPRPRAPVTNPSAQQGHGENILLVEDEQSLRVLANRILSRHGYHVYQAITGPAAVEYAADPGHVIDLLLTDIVMPDILGTEVAEQVHWHRPGLPVVYMSGYAQPILDTHGATDPQMNILEKRFTETTLLTRVYQALQPAPHPPSPSA